MGIHRQTNQYSKKTHPILCPTLLECTSKFGLQSVYSEIGRGNIMKTSDKCPVMYINTLTLVIAITYLVYTVCRKCVKYLPSIIYVLSTLNKIDPKWNSLSAMITIE